MFFCPFCGTLLLVQQDEESGLNALKCRTCSYIQPITEAMGPLTVTHLFTEHQKVVNDNDDGGGDAGSSNEVKMLEGEQEITMPCQNEKGCDSEKVYFSQIQMRSADEPQTTFYRCVKCGFRWRED